MLPDPFHHARRLTLAFPLLAALVLAFSGVAHAAACYPARTVKLWHSDGATTGTLVWKAPLRKPKDFAGYRVWRSGKVVGQTKRTKMPVNVSLGQTYLFVVRPALRSGKVASCAARLKIAIGNPPPGAPLQLNAQDMTGKQATLSWLPATGQVSGYRIFRDAQVVGQTKKLTYTANVVSDRTYVFTVAAVNSAGKLGQTSKPFSLTVQHRPPGEPSQLGATKTDTTSITLTWAPAVAGSAPVTGYRIIRDNKIVGQVPGTSFQANMLAAGVNYAFQVAAVDSRGYLSPLSEPLTVTLGPYNPPTAPQSLAATGISDSTVTLSWANATASPGGRIVGYRIWRDGNVVRQTSDTTVTISNLYAVHDYSFTVAAIDSRGLQSEQTPALAVSTVKPAQSHGHVHAFLLATTGQSFKDLQAHYQQISDIYTTYFDCNSDGSFSGGNDKLVTGWAQLHGIHVNARFNCQRTSTLDLILNSPALRKQTIDQMVSSAVQNGFDGINVDFEAGAAADRDAYSSFISELAQALHAVGIQLSIDVSAKSADVPNHPRSTFFDYNALTAAADRVIVMGWGIHWQTSGPGSTDDITWLNKVAGYMNTIAGRSKFTLGFSMYGFDWPAGGGTSHPATAYEYTPLMQLEQQVGATSSFDATAQQSHFSYTDGNGVAHEVWFSDHQSLSTRFQLAQSNGWGVALWRLGTEDQAIWNDRALQP